MTDQTEVMIVGGGPGGLSAALAAAQTGANVTLIDMYRTPGGQYYREKALPGPGKVSGRQLRSKRLRKEVLEAGVRILTETVVWGTFGGKVLALQGKDSPTSIESETIIIATGTTERAIAFPGWTLQGVMTAGAAQTMLYHGVLPGKKPLFVGTGPLQLIVAAEAAKSGARVVSVLEAMTALPSTSELVAGMWGQWSRLTEGLTSYLTLGVRGMLIRMGWGIVAAKGDGQVEEAIIGRVDSNWRMIPGTEKTIACDSICLGYGFVPSNALLSLLGVDLEFRPELGGEVPKRDALMQTNIPGVYAVGDCAGVGGGPMALLEGQIAGISAAARAGHNSYNAEALLLKLWPALVHERRFQRLYSSLFTPRPGIYELVMDDTLLCRCEEVTAAEVRRAIKLGANTDNEVKAVTRCGMGNCEGRVCSQILANFVARETNSSLNNVGLLRPRPPLYPLSIDQLCSSTPGGWVANSVEDGQ
jgi:D-hydroxyproline dehydrogenase subunit alpha